MVAAAIVSDPVVAVAKRPPTARNAPPVRRTNPPRSHTPSATSTPLAARLTTALIAYRGRLSASGHPSSAIRGKAKGGHAGRPRARLEARRRAPRLADRAGA